MEAAWRTTSYKQTVCHLLSFRDGSHATEQCVPISLITETCMSFPNHNNHSKSTGLAATRHRVNLTVDNAYYNNNVFIALGNKKIVLQTSLKRLS